MGLLDRYVREIVEKKHHITPQNIMDLRDVLPEETRPEDSAAAPDDSHGQTPSLSKLLNKLTKTAEMLFSKAQVSKDADELKSASTTLKQCMDVGIKYAEKIAASDRAIMIENALFEAVNSFEDEELKERFLAHLKEVLDV